ncbi:MAG: MFS transporter [Peptococcaceae bacterium]|nr:MFS transporter [Peptococcaceae bacterium]
MSVQKIGNSLPKKKVYYSFVVLYLMFMVDFMTRTGVNSLVPLIQEDLGLTDVQVGMLSSVVMIGMVIFVLPVTFFADRISRKKTVIVLSIFWGIAVLVSSQTTSYETLLLTRFFVGVGCSGFAAVSTSMISGWFSEEQRGKALSIYDTAMDVGAAFAAAACGMIAGLMGWQTTLLFVGILSLIITVFSFFIPDEKRHVKKDETKAKSDVNLTAALKAVFANKPLLAVSLGAAFNNFLYCATFGWINMYMVRDMGYSVGLAGSIAGAISLVGVLGYPIGGVILDKWYKHDIRSRAWLPAISAVLSGICNVIAVYFQCIPFLFIGYVIVTIAAAAPHICTQELVEEHFRSTSYGMYVIFIQAFGAVGPTLAGSLSEATNLMTSLILIQIAGVLAGIMFAIAGKMYIPTYKKVKEAENK